MLWHLVSTVFSAAVCSPGLCSRRVTDIILPLPLGVTRDLGRRTGMRLANLNVQISRHVSENLLSMSRFSEAGITLGMRPANERRRYLYNGVSHWLVAFSNTDPCSDRFLGIQLDPRNILYFF